MKKLFNILKEKLAPLSSKLQSLKSILPQKKPHSEKYYKRIAFLNKYSLIFHFLLACLLISCRGDDFQTGLCERYNFHQQSHACILI